MRRRAHAAACGARRAERPVLGTTTTAGHVECGTRTSTAVDEVVRGQLLTSARYLEENSVDEWRRAYINYRGLKKLIKRIDTHYRARTGREEVEQDTTSNNGSRFRLPLLGRWRSNVSNYGSISEEAQEPLAPIEVSDLHLTLAPERRHPSETLRDDIELQPIQSLDDKIHAMFDYEERKFFRALDGEIERIERFYLEHENDAILRLNMLVNQLSELAEHRREYRAQVHHESVMNGLSSGDMTKHNAPEIDAGDQRRVESIQSLHDLDIKPAHTPHDPHVPRDPQRYIAARKKLRAAVIENYRALEILNNYRFLNRQGFSKILKKFDKTLGTAFLDTFYSLHVLGTPLTNSDRVPKMIQGSEEIFASYFVHGDVKRARDILRESNGAQSSTITRHHGVVFVTGVYIGISACAIAGGLADALRPETQAVLPQWQQLLQVYSAEFVPTFFAFIFGLNLVGWQYARINAVFIFEWDAATMLDPVQFFELPSVLILTLSLCFWISFHFPSGPISPTSLPLWWLLFAVFLVGNPFPILHQSGRMWFIQTLLRVFDAGILTSVSFRDFFIGDELNSLAWSISNLWYIGCECVSGWPFPDTCNSAATLWVPFLAALPAMLRLGQCIRRYVDSDMRVLVHIVNAFKYLASIVAPFCFFWYRQSGTAGMMAVWCVSAAVNSTYTAAWDLAMDWDLLKPNAHYPLLRNNLAFEDIWPMYYVAMTTNVVLRFSWILNAVGMPAAPLTRAVLIALLEMGRRWQWNFIRLENEHLGNADSFKIIRDMPLPYPVVRPAAEEDERTSPSRHDDDSSEHTKQVLQHVHTRLVAALRLNQTTERRSGIHHHTDASAPG